MLRRVDGVPHVVLGTALLAAVAPSARVVGTRPGALAAVLSPFTAHGVAVVVGGLRTLVLVEVIRPGVEGG